MSSLTRKVKRGTAKVLFNPDSKKFESYERSKRGKFLRGAESLAAEQVDARGLKYELRAAELKHIEEKAAIQERARKLEQ